MGQNTKDFVGMLAFLAMAGELCALAIFAWLRQRTGKPLKPKTVVLWVVLIISIGMIGAVMAPVLVAAQ